jgi:hypothetical protein
MLVSQIYYLVLRASAVLALRLQTRIVCKCLGMQCHQPTDQAPGELRSIIAALRRGELPEVTLHPERLSLFRWRK